MGRWPVLGAAFVALCGCQDKVDQQAFASPDGKSRLVSEQRSGGGAAGWSDQYLYLEFDGSAERFPIAQFTEYMPRFAVTWTSDRSVNVCARGETPYWTDRVQVRTEGMVHEVEIASVCDGMRVVSERTRVEEFKRDAGQKR